MILNDNLTYTQDTLFCVERNSKHLLTKMNVYTFII